MQPPTVEYWPSQQGISVVQLLRVVAQVVELREYTTNLNKKLEQSDHWDAANVRRCELKHAQGEHECVEQDFGKHDFAEHVVNLGKNSERLTVN